MHYKSYFLALVCVITLGIWVGLPQISQADTVYAWGYNDGGLLGDGTTTDRNTPVAVSGLDNSVTIVAGGSFHSLAVQNGAVYAWGSNYYGQLGDGTTIWHNTPVAVSGLDSGITAIAGGGDGFSLAIKNGAVYAWGHNRYGQIGDGTTIQRNTPVAVSGLGSGVTAIAGGGDFSLAIKNGAAYAWGRNNQGQLGGGMTEYYRNTPVAVSGLDSGVTAIAGGQEFSLAIKNGAVFAWGANYRGQLGDSTTTSHCTPVAVSGLDSGVTAIAAGSDHSLAVRNGEVYAWGYNEWGQLGNGTDLMRSAGTMASCYVPTLVSGLSNIIDVAASWSSSYALSADGSLWAWGDNSCGELGLGDTNPILYYGHDDRLTPVQVLAPNGYKFTSIDCDGLSVIATVAPVPEPCTLALLGLGGLAMLKRRR